MNNNTATAEKPTKKRATYGFKLDFPKTEFTLRDLRKKMSYKMSYITGYKRITSAIAKGVIEIAGEKNPAHSRRGRKEITYRRTNVKQTVLSAKKIVAPAVSFVSPASVESAARPF